MCRTRTQRSPDILGAPTAKYGDCVPYELFFLLLASKEVRYDIDAR
jgi:hypothetical protein